MAKSRVRCQTVRQPQLQENRKPPSRRTCEAYSRIPCASPTLEPARHQTANCVLLVLRRASGIARVPAQLAISKKSNANLVFSILKTDSSQPFRGAKSRPQKIRHRELRVGSVKQVMRFPSDSRKGRASLAQAVHKVLVSRESSQVL